MLCAYVNEIVVVCRPERKKEVAESKGGDSGSESAPPDDDAASSTASSGFGSLTKKKNYGTHLPLGFPFSQLTSLGRP
jgi:hypothetical protein